MKTSQVMNGSMACKLGVVAVAAVVAITLSFGVTSEIATPEQAFASTGNLEAASVTVGTQAGSDLATTNKKKINSTAKSNAKAVVKAAKATSGTNKEKLAKVFKYLATDKKLLTFGEYYSDFYFLAKSAADKAYYPTSQPTNMKAFYKKYAIDAYKTKKASCHHYAALFAIAAKQALGKNAVVKIGTRNVVVDGVADIHSWVEVQLTKGGTTFVYDAQKGNEYSKDHGKNNFGKFCGSKKSAMKSYYKKYKNAQYCTVTL